MLVNSKYPANGGHHPDHSLDPEGKQNRPGGRNQQRPKCELDGGCQISNQCKRYETDGGYLLGKCSLCWKEYCEIYDWDPELSYAANELCDDKEIPLDERVNIDQNNIFEVLGLPQGIKYCHVSQNRYKERNRNSDDSGGEDSKSNSLSEEAPDEDFDWKTISYKKYESPDSSSSSSSDSASCDSSSSYSAPRNKGGKRKVKTRSLTTANKKRKCKITVDLANDSGEGSSNESNEFSEEESSNSFVANDDSTISHESSSGNAF